MNCEDFQGQYLGKNVDSAASAHLAGCTWCRSRIAEFDMISDQLGNAAMWESPSAELEDQIVSTISGTATHSDGRTKRLKLVAAAAAFVVIGGSVTGLFVRSQQPDWEISLPAVGEVSAIGSVAGWNTEAGTRMVFTIDNLDPAGTEEFYEIWLTADDGRHVSAGTFRSSGQIESYAGVSRRDFPRIWITLEPNDGDEGINGPTVLDTHP